MGRSWVEVWGQGGSALVGAVVGALVGPLVGAPFVGQTSLSPALCVAHARGGTTGTPAHACRDLFQAKSGKLTFNGNYKDILAIEIDSSFKLSGPEALASDHFGSTFSVLPRKNTEHQLFFCPGPKSNLDSGNSALVIGFSRDQL